MAEHADGGVTVEVGHAQRALDELAKRVEQLREQPAPEPTTRPVDAYGRQWGWTG